jgi:hypothetical protein
MLDHEDPPPPADGRAVVDVSNVCYSAELPPRVDGPQRPHLDRLSIVVGEWRRRYGADASIRCVVDASVSEQLDLRRQPVARELAIEVTPYADEVILDYAQDEGRYVVSGDRFVDHRRAYPWIESQPARFLHWRYRGGTVEFVPSGIRHRPPHLVSERSEVKRLRNEGLHPDRDRALLETRWRCATEGCIRAQCWQMMLLSWPRRDASGTAICPGCRAELVAIGPRGVFAEVVVHPIDSDDELTRFPLDHEAPLVVGRGRRDQGISLDTVPGVPAAIGRLSRQHALLRLDADRRLHVVDLGSTNGTVVRRSPGGRASRLPDGESQVVPPHGRVELAGVLRLELSGKRFSSTLPPAPRASSDNRRTEFGPVGGALPR